jgi:hypothetical protein
LRNADVFGSGHLRTSSDFAGRMFD